MKVRNSYRQLLRTGMFLAMLMCLHQFSALGQNTKGDRPTSSRETRFQRSGPRKAIKSTRNRRIRMPAGNAPRRSRPVQTRTKENGSARYGGNQARVKPRSESSRMARRNIYSQRNQYVNNPSRTPDRQRQPVVSNAPTLRRLKKLQGDPNKESPKVFKPAKPLTASRAYIRSKSINVYANFRRPRRKGEQATLKDIAGRTLRARNFSTPAQKISRYAFNPYVYRKRRGDQPYRGPSPSGYRSGRKSGEQAWKGDISGRRIRAPRTQAQASSGRRIGPTPGGSRLKPGRKPLPALGPGAGSALGSRFRGSLPALGNSRTPNRRGRGLWNNRQQPLAVKNAGLGRAESRFRGRNIGYLRPSKGGGSATMRHWNNKNKAIPVKNAGATGMASNFRGRMKGQRPLKGGGSVSGRLWNNRNSAIPVRNAGRGTGSSSFAGNLRAGRPLKGGGSVSGRTWNNRNSAIPVRNAGRGTSQSSFAGNLRAGRPLKGGGSVSGRIWNNRNSAIPVRNAGRGTSQSSFAGNLRARRPLKGGGSVSGRIWNNRNSAIPVRNAGRGTTQSSFAGNLRRFQESPGMNDQGEEFAGIKRIPRKPAKGGGSVSGVTWNNKENPVQGKSPSRASTSASGFPGKWKRFQLSPGFNDQGEEFTGTYRGPRKPLKGGGSVSGVTWNNKETPVTGRKPNRVDRAQSAFSGRHRRFEVSPGFADQGEEFTGTMRLPRLAKPYVKNENAPENQLKKRRPDETTYLVDRMYAVVKVRKRVRNKNAAEEAPLKYEPTKATLAVAGLQQKVKRRAYVRNKLAAEEALLKLEPTATTRAVAGLQQKVRQYHYKHNPSSAAEAQKVREPGKAFARATDYQGNIRMAKFKLYDQQRQQLFPDSRFIQLQRNNVKGEKSLLTSIKLWWSRNFRKQETEPVKAKERKPRYDKGEIGLWYD